MATGVQLRQPAVTEGLVFEQTAPSIDRYVVTGVGERYVSFRRVGSRPFETRAGRLAEPIHIESREDVERLLSTGEIRAIDGTAN
ncbi:hypothetical protein [Halalkalicoccus ordinarius]|uniref:hypothetical protein n=1 Tax=Halalkalicoccus ordinarius TaxID=3116651 RepID=UPI00300F32B7